MNIVWFAAGLVALILGAELLVRGASKLALSFGISPLVVGLTVVSFGTSSPELAVSTQSAWSGEVDIALGNVVGSNLANILLILGASAMVVPMTVHRQVIRQEVPVMIGVSLLLWALAMDGAISRWDGFLFVVLLLAYTVLVIRQSRREQGLSTTDDRGASSAGWEHGWGAQAGLILVGLALLVIGSQWLVESAVAFAIYLGVSELIIGLTVVAVGTSLPELATSLMAAMKGERDIAVGNVVGSNIFNILAVLGISASVAPTDLIVPASLLAFDLPAMVAVAVICLPIFFAGGCVARWEGALFLSYYIAYTVYLILNASGHDALVGYTDVMGHYVIPITVATVLAVAWRHWRATGGVAHRPSL